MAYNFLDYTNLEKYTQAVKNKTDAQYVKQIAGKGLSTRDFTAEDESKLDGIQANATKNDTKYNNATPSTVAVGGIAAGYTPPSEGIELKALIDKMLHPWVAPTVAASIIPTNGGVVEAGTTQNVTGVKVVVTKKSSNITKIEVLNGATVKVTLTENITNGGTFTASFTESVKTDTQYNVKVTDADSKVTTAYTGKFEFVYPYYYGAVNDGVELNEATIKGLTKNVSKKGNKTFNFNCENQKIVYAYPKSYGTLSKILDKNQFDVTKTFTRTEVQVNGQDYYVYANSPSTVSGFAMTFNY